MSSSPRLAISAPLATEPPSQRDHLVRLSDEWALWKWFALRGTGFPVDLMLRLADPDAATAIDRYLRAEAEAAARCAEAVTQLRARRRAPVSRAEHRAITKAIRRLVAKQPPATVDGVGGVDHGVIERCAQACARRDQLRAIGEAACAAARDGNAAALRAIASDPRFREALLWQNRAAVATSVEHLLRQPGGVSDTRTRYNELMVATYVQRYSAKNDTIGFFGPVGWGTWTPDHRPALMRPGRSLLARRAVFFEHWAITALAGKLAENAELLRDVAPRMFPAARLDGTTLRVQGRTIEVPRLVARILSACDGRTSARAIAAALVRDPTLELSGADPVYAQLAALAEQRAILWALEIPTSNPYPERSLAELLQRMPASPHRARAEAALDELTGARDAVARAAGDPLALDPALAAFDATFTRLTGAAPTRHAGRVYGARTPLYEDCSRDLALVLGAPVLAELAPLRLVLHCARWLAGAIAERYLELFESTYRELCSALGTSTVDYQRFVAALEPHLPSTGRTVPPIVAGAVAELQARWSGLIPSGPAQRRIQLRAEDLAPAIAAWPCGRLLWPDALFHSPDLMIAARDLDAISRGDLLFVLGELHITINSVIGFGLWAPEPAAMAERYLTDLGQTFLDEVFPLHGTIRGDALRLVVPGSLAIEADDARSRLPRDCVLPVSGLEICEHDGRVVVRTSSQGASPRSLELLSVFSWRLTWATLATFSLFPEQAHVPRISIDRLVVHRESWRFEPGELAFASASTGFERWCGARRWMHAAGLPRWVFVRIPEEAKPYCVDFESAISVELLAKLVRKASMVKVSEMLPTPDEAWLTDAEGRRYSCELRTSALDLRPSSAGR